MPHVPGLLRPIPWRDTDKLNGSPMANCIAYSRRTEPVGSFPANRFGLYDMIGDVGEWTEDLLEQSLRRRAVRRLAMDERRLQFSRRPRPLGLQVGGSH